MKQVIPAILLAALLVIFFAGMPLLTTCRLPAVKKSSKMGKRDWRSLLLIMVCYGAVAFWDLGNTISPESFVPMENDEAVITFSEPQELAKIWLFSGVGIGHYEIYTSEDGQNWTMAEAFSQTHVEVLKWNEVTLPMSRPVRAVWIRGTGSPWLGEISFVNGAGERPAFTCTLAELCDEADTVPETSSYRNSSYFDEIYHARTAWEHLHGVWPYEISHPPLGKEILSLGILLFGMTPFGWRFSGTVAGILMLPVMYLFLKRLFGGRKIPAAGTILLAAGFMHFTQTRIATIDSYAVLFILLMFYFMYRFVTEEKLSMLALCGVCFGLGAASKWTCLYAGAGLAVIWLIFWIGKIARKEERAVSRFLLNIPFCLVFFVLIPGLIYYLSYIPYGTAENCRPFSADYTKLVLDNQSFMFTYHAGIVAEHPYSSKWYQWVLNIRPILYYLEYFDDGTRSSIAAFVNPAICWGGLISVLVLLFMAVYRRDGKAGFLLAAYFSGLIPWMFITRLTFEYHYFASAVMLPVALCYIFALMRENGKRWKPYVFGFTLVSVLLFVLFFPVLGGMRVNGSLAHDLLAWLPTWPI